MFRYASGALLLLFCLGTLVALLPVSSSMERRGVELYDVQMRLYPRTEREDVVWLFGAQKVVHQPESGESLLTGLEQGKRLVKGELDMTLSAKTITVDAQDNLYTDRVQLSIPRVCATISFGRVGEGHSVRIDQNSGFSGPDVDYRDAYSVMTAKSIRSDFELKNASMPGQKLRISLDPTNECKNGQIVPKEDKK